VSRPTHRSIPNRGANKVCASLVPGWNRPIGRVHLAIGRSPAIDLSCPIDALQATGLPLPTELLLAIDLRWQFRATDSLLPTEPLPAAGLLLPTSPPLTTDLRSPVGPHRTIVLTPCDRPQRRDFPLRVEPRLALALSPSIDQPRARLRDAVTRALNSPRTALCRRRRSSSA